MSILELRESLFTSIPRYILYQFSMRIVTTNPHRIPARARGVVLSHSVAVVGIREKQHMGRKCD